MFIPSHFFSRKKTKKSHHFFFFHSFVVDQGKTFLIFSTPPPSPFVSSPNFFGKFHWHCAFFSRFSPAKNNYFLALLFYTFRGNRSVVPLFLLGLLLVYGCGGRRRLALVEEVGDEVNWQREDDRGVLLRRDRVEGL